MPNEQSQRESQLFLPLDQAAAATGAASKCQLAWPSTGELNDFRRQLSPHSCVSSSHLLAGEQQVGAI